MDRSQQLLERYEGNRVIRGLIQLIPFGAGSALDTVLIQTVDKIRTERAQVFFDELADGEVVFDDDLLRSEDFIHKYFSTAQYALNSRKREKIRLFGCLLKDSLLATELVDIDQYEELLQVLDELGYRELVALQILDSYSDRPRTEEQNDLQWTRTFWDEFLDEVSERLTLPREEVQCFMIRIARTGCYQEFAGGYLSYTGGVGELTPIYYRLKRTLSEREDNV